MERLTRPPEVNVSLGDYIAMGFQTWLSQLLGVQSAHGTKIAQLESQLAEGSSFYDKFNRPNNVLLGNGWLQGGDGQGLGIIDYAARINNLGIATGRRYAIAPTTMTEDSHLVSVIVNPKGVSRVAMTSLFIQGNSDMTQFAYANVYGRAVYIGYGTRSGNSWTFNDWASNTDVKINESDVLEWRCDGDVYTLLQNNIPLLTWTDSANQHPRDASHRKVGFASDTRFALVWHYAWGLASFNARNIMGYLKDVKQQAKEAGIAAAAAQTAVSDLQNQQEGGGLPVTMINAGFPGNTTSLDLLKWNAPRTGDQSIRHYNDNASLQWKWLNIQYTTWALYNDPLSLTDQVVRIVFGTSSFEDQGTGIIINSNSTGSSFVFAQFYSDKFKVGRAHFTGTTVTFDEEWINQPCTVGNGTQVEVRSHTLAGTTTYTIRLNGGLIGSKTTTPPASDAKYVGFFMQRFENIFGQYWVSGNIKHFFASDYVLPALASPGWSVYRNSTDPSGNPINIAGYQDFIAPVFDTLGGVSGLEVMDYTRGIFKVLKSGWYSITLRLQSSIANGTSSLPRAVIYTSSGPALSGVPVIRRVGPEGAASSNAYTFGVSCVLYMYANDLVRCGMYSSVTTRRLVGDSLASVTYFEGALIGQ